MKKVVLFLAASAFLAVWAIVAFPEMGGAEMATSSECLIVRIQGDPAQPDQIQLEPTTLWVKKGDCVVWFNNLRISVPEVMIKFREGKKCGEMTEAPSGFKLDAIEDCYVTGMIPYAGTSSLRFQEKGEFAYEIMGAGKEIAKGKIVVQE